MFGSIFKKGARWWFVSVAVTVVAGIGLSLCFWGILHNDKDSFSTTISNLSLVLGGSETSLQSVKGSNKPKEKKQWRYHNLMMFYSCRH